MQLTFCCDRCVAVLEETFKRVKCIVVRLVRTQFLQSQTLLQAVLLCGLLTQCEGQPNTTLASKLT